jgi:hypothetical protein
LRRSLRNQPCDASASTRSEKLVPILSNVIAAKVVGLVLFPPEHRQIDFADVDVAHFVEQN